MKLEELLEANKTGAEGFKHGKTRGALNYDTKDGGDAKNARKAKKKSNVDKPDMDRKVTKPDTPEDQKETDKQVPGTKKKKNLKK